MKSIVTGLLLVLVVHNGIAQKSPIKFGDVSLEELKMTKYPADTSASAVILADYGVSSIEYRQDFVLEFERTTRIKILSKDGLAWANFTIPLYHDRSKDEKISNLKAITYNLDNGKIVETKLKNDAVFKEKFDDNIDLLKITLPNVKAGSVVEITYRIMSDFLFNFQDWEFQNTIPIVWSEYRARIPEYFNYDKYMQGYVPFAINESTTSPSSITLNSSERSEGNVVKATFTNEKIDFQENRYRWVAKNVPAFKSEPFMTTYKDYISKINFELGYIKFPNQPIQPIMGSWEEINKRYAESENVGGEIKGNGFLKKTVEEITAGTTSAQQKIAAIINYVKTNIEWDGRTQKFVSGSLRKIVEAKKGNSADINLLLASMLEKAHLDVSAVLISTRDHGFVREHIPVSSQFNNILCMVHADEKDFLLDATDKLLPIGLLPERCLNGSGFVVSKSGYKWIALGALTKSRTTISADLTLNSEGALKGKLDFTRDGYDAHRMRQNYYSKGEEAYAKDLISGTTWELNKSEFKNAQEIDLPIKELHELTINEHVSVAGDVMYINPLITNQLIENPFKLEKREYPVDFGSPMERIYLAKITIPEGYQVDEIPKSKILLMPGNGAKYTYNVAQTGNTLSVVSNLQINKSLFIQDEYPNLREFYNQVVAKQAEQIVLKKK